MAVHVKVGGVWKQASSVYEKVAGVWKQAIDMPVKVSGVWKTGVLAQGAFESIATWTASGGEGSVTISSIPQTYKHLQLRIIYRDTSTTSDTNAGLNIRPNSNSDSIIDWHNLQGTGSMAQATNSTNETAIAVVRAGWTSNGGNTTVYGATIMDLPDYASTSKYKTFRFISGVDKNNGSATSGLSLTSGLYRTTSAVTSLYITPSWSAFAAGSQIALYGIKG